MVSYHQREIGFSQPGEPIAHGPKMQHPAPKNLSASRSSTAVFDRAPLEHPWLSESPDIEIGLRRARADRRQELARSLRTGTAIGGQMGDATEAMPRIPQDPFQASLAALVLQPIRQ
jgi:hypothetical protein